MPHLSNIYRLGVKELWSLARDPIMLVLIAYMFTGSIYVAATAVPETLHKAPIAIVDEDGSPLSARGLAKLLGPYRVGPAQRRVRGEKSRGYQRRDFTDAWTRYVPAQESGTSGTSGTPEQDPVPDVPDAAAVPVTEPTPVGTVWDFDAPLCSTCGRRKRAVPTIPGRFVCTFPHHAYGEVLA